MNSREEKYGTAKASVSREMSGLELEQIISKRLQRKLQEERFAREESSRLRSCVGDASANLSLQLRR